MLSSSGERERSKVPAAVNTYDQINIEIPEGFPEEGVSARAAEGNCEQRDLDRRQSRTEPLLLRDHVLRARAARHLPAARAQELRRPRTCIRTPSSRRSKIVRWLHDLWNGPKDAEPYGAATIGSSEACMLAGLAHKWNWRAQRQKAGKDETRPNLVTGGNVQIVWKKYMRYFDVEPHIVPLKRGDYRLTAERLEEFVDENTTCVVAIAGQTFTGEDDDIKESTNGSTTTSVAPATRSRCTSTAPRVAS